MPKPNLFDTMERARRDLHFAREDRIRAERTLEALQRKEVAARTRCAEALNAWQSAVSAESRLNHITDTLEERAL